MGLIFESLKRPVSVTYRVDFSRGVTTFARCILAGSIPFPSTFYSIYSYVRLKSLVLMLILHVINNFIYHRILLAYI